MAYLSDNDRAEICARFQSDGELGTETFGAMTKADLRAAFNAIDAYLEDNKLTINNTIPQPARGAMTTKQKARLLVYVVERRYLTGN
jgi:hypothetical protein